ncbi:MAG: sugar transferase [Rhodobiaceae bacterium]|nr:sugar transferase [Rhodobiaceae bacterium]
MSTSKRIFDFLASFGLLLILIVPLLAVALALRVSIGSPVLFRQKRVGLEGQLFHIVKFRTMRDAVDSDGKSLPDEERMTTIGRLLRASSVDELPELWNILSGEMSFVGPRPLLPEYLPHYLPDQMRRHDVRPGLTGLAQVNGRNNQSWDDRFKLDVEYVDKQSFWFDVNIMLKTVQKVLSRDGVSAEGHETMPRFDEQVKAGLARGKMTEDAQR